MLPTRARRSRLTLWTSVAHVGDRSHALPLSSLLSSHVHGIVCRRRADTSDRHGPSHGHCPLPPISSTPTPRLIIITLVGLLTQPEGRSALVVCLRPSCVPSIPASCGDQPRSLVARIRRVSVEDGPAPRWRCGVEAMSS